MITSLKLYSLLLEKSIQKNQFLSELLGKMSDPIARELVKLKEVPDDAKIKFDFFKLNDNGNIEASIENRHNTIIKVGTFLTALKPFLTKDFKDYEIENFINKFNLLLNQSKSDTSNFTVKLIEGNDIGNFYQLKNCVNSDWKGPLLTSCLRDGNMKMFDLYAKNKKEIKLLALLDENNKIRARALIFYLDSGEIFLEKIYSINNDDSMAIFNYFKNKMNGKYSEEESNLSNDETVSLSYRPIYLEKVPYLDTFRYWNDNGNVLQQNDNDIINGLAFTNSDGTATTYGNIVNLNRSSKHLGFAYLSDTVETYSGDIELASDCVKTKDDKWALEEECIKDYNKEYILKDDAVELHDGRYALKDDVVTTDKGEYALEYECVKIDKWTWALETDCVKDKYGNYILEEEAVEVIEGGYVNKEDAYKLSNGDYSINPEDND